MPRVIVCLVLFLFAAGAPAVAQEAPRNVILFVADGCGPASFTMARDFLRDQQGQDTLAIDRLQTGSIRTFASDSRVTDSAAGATAFACAVKTYNGAIAVDSLRQPVATLVEAAEQRGMATGLVATSRITHATPAAFSSHVTDRGEEALIAEQQVEHGIEVLMGGGWGWYLPEAAGGWRPDSVDVLERAAAKGYAVVRDPAGFGEARTTPLLALFAESHMDYEIDRTDQPSLAQMTTRAVELLAATTDAQENGFFLMVEGSRIDHAGHANDAAAHLYDVIAFDEAVAAAMDFARQDGRTLVVSTSDHETGGLSLGRDGTYAWHPEVLARVTSSVGPMLQATADGAAPADVLREHAGIDSLTADEQAALRASAAQEEGAAPLSEAVKGVIDRRALVAWTTSGHTAVDVNLYAYGPGQERFVGHHDNTYVGAALADLLGFDLEALTRALRRNAEPAAARQDL